MRLSTCCTSIAVALTVLSGSVGGQGARQSAPRVTCAMYEVNREVLQVREMEAYVEPTALAIAGRSTLLAGFPNYLWRRSEDGWDLAATNGIFGVVISETGQRHIVESPLKGRAVRAVRAVAVGNGIWDVVFSELRDAEVSSGLAEKTRALWYGRLSGTGWSVVEELPVPTEEWVRHRSLSNLFAYGNSLTVAVPLERSDDRRDVLVLTRRDGRWNAEVVADGYAQYVAVGQAASDSLLLLVVSIDPDLDPGQFDHNSLFAYERQGAWRPRIRIVHGGSEPVFAPTLVRAPQGIAMSWWTAIDDELVPRRVARVLVGRGSQTTAGDQPITLDTSVTYGGRAVVLRDSVFWILEHVAPESGEKELRWLRLRTGGAEIVGRLSSPFTGPFAAAVTASERVVVAGPRFSQEHNVTPLATLLLEFEHRCG